MVKGPIRFLSVTFCPKLGSMGKLAWWFCTKLPFQRYQIWLV